MKRLGVFLLTALAVSLASAQWIEVPFVGGVWQGIYFADSLNGWITSGISNSCGRTRDGGRTWTYFVPPVPPQAVGFNAVYFADTLHGILAGASGYGIGPGVIIRTTNGGQTWVQVTHPAANSLWEEIAVVGDSLWVVGSYWSGSAPRYGLMLRAPLSALFSSAPIPWTFYEYPQFWGFVEIAVVSPSLVWLSGGGLDSLDNWRPSLCHTTDGGRTFINDVHKVQVPADDILGSIVFADSLHGWLGIEDWHRANWHTTDGGETWAPQSQSWRWPPEFIPLDSQVLYGADTGPGPLYRIWKSTNGGQTWHYITEGQTMDVPENAFRLSDRHMWFLGGSSVWYYVPVAPPQIQPIASDTIRVDSVTERQAQAQGWGLRYGLINSPAWVSIDALTGLITERPQVQHVGVHTVTVQVRDTVAQFATASYQLTVVLPLPGVPVPLAPGKGAVGISTSPTLVWANVPYAQWYRVQFGPDSTFVSPQTLLVDTIVTSNSLQLTGLENNRQYFWRVQAGNATGQSDWSEIFYFLTSATDVRELPGVPTEFRLEQNYPNPFNLTTVIRYAIPHSADVRLAVYNLLGQEVAVLVAERQHIGNYQVAFNAASLPSGIYFCRLQAGTSAINNKKMALIK